MRTLSLMIALVTAGAGSWAEIVDSLVAAVDNTAIKHSDVMREIRLAAFMNKQDPSFSAESQKEAVNRLIDQALIKQEIENGMYVPEDPKAADSLLRQLRDSYGGDEGLSKALAARGLTEEMLKKQIDWEATVLRFVQLRFGGGVADAETVNQAFFAWLDQMRKNRRVQIQEARLK